MTAKEIQVYLTNVFDELKSSRSEISQQISQYDLQEQDLLHCLEAEKCDAVQLVKISVHLKDIRLKRRKLKIEFDKLTSISSNLPGNIRNSIKTKQLERFEEKTYTCKTDALIDITNRHQGDVIIPFKK